MLSFLFLGTFHWQRYEVTGITSSSSSADDVEDDVGCTLKFFAVIATSACNTAETCTAVFEKHNYQKQKKRRISITDFDLRPVECRGTAKALLPKLLESICGESLGVLVLFDPTYCHQTIPASHPDVPSNSAIKQTVAAFKKSRRMPAAKLREIEQNTRAQRDSPLWLIVHRYRITASQFGEILHHKADTPPDRLVLSILQLRSFSSAATDWGYRRVSSNTAILLLSM